MEGDMTCMLVVVKPVLCGALVISGSGEVRRVSVLIMPWLGRDCEDSGDEVPLLFPGHTTTTATSPPPSRSPTELGTDSLHTSLISSIMLCVWEKV